MRLPQGGWELKKENGIGSSILNTGKELKLRR
jgi:hypothetical protein